MYKKLWILGTVPPGVTNLVAKCAGNSKENYHEASWRELCALQSNRAKCRGGPSCPPPPPSLIRVKRALEPIRKGLRASRSSCDCAHIIFCPPPPPPPMKILDPPLILESSFYGNSVILHWINGLKVSMHKSHANTKQKFARKPSIMNW